MDKNEMYDFLENVVGASRQTLSVATCICGFNEKTMSDVLYALTGYEDFDEYAKEFCED